MTIKHDIRMILRKAGLDLSRFDPAQSADARMQMRLQSNQIDTVLDVGANDGGYARTLRSAGFRGRILSFEPLAGVHERLLQAARGHSDHWQVAPRMALGESEGTVEINVAGNSTSSSILPMLDRHLDSAPQSRYVGKDSVALRRLDSVRHTFIDQARRIHLKIDTQGYEWPVLNGAEGLMQRVSGLQVEMSLVPLYDGQMLFRELYDWIIGRGFELHGVIPGFGDPRTGRMLQMDGIFFRG